jgi:hypothetical protein
MFHVPNKHRVRTGQLASRDEFGNNGAFLIPSPTKGRLLAVVASDGFGWEHVSVHAENKIGNLFTPYWEEMQFLKQMFWDGTDVVIQFHPADANYVNIHKNVLHMWRMKGWESDDTSGHPLPTPPLALV